jgi:hypothetical protein
MKLSNLIAAALSLFVASTARAQVCPYENLMPEFAGFVAATGDLEPAARASVTRFVTSIGTLQRTAVRLARPNAQARPAPVRSAGRRTGARPITSTMCSPPGGHHYRLCPHRGHFPPAFADYRRETPISFGLSPHMSDGTRRLVRRRACASASRLRCCIRRGNRRRSFTTSFFHVYQAHKSAQPCRPTHAAGVMGAEPKGSRPTSVELNPTLTAGDFRMPRDLQTRVAELAEAARLMLPDLDSHEGYGRWFTVGSNPPGLPTRSGYYLGYLMAKRLDHGDLAALARMPPEQVAREARSFLESLAASPAKP